MHKLYKTCISDQNMHLIVIYALTLQIYIYIKVRQMCPYFVFRMPIICKIQGFNHVYKVLDIFLFT